MQLPRPTLLLLLAISLLPNPATADPDPDPAPEPQVAEGGGVAASSPNPAQYPVVTTANSLFTINGVTSASYLVFTQTFAATALGTWDLGPTPLAGSIGLGSISGTLKGRGWLEAAVETPGPEI